MKKRLRKWPIVDVAASVLIVAPVALSGAFVAVSAFVVALVVAALVGGTRQSDIAGRKGTP